MLAFMQLVFRYLFLAQSYVDLALTDFNYVLLVIATVCIAAGGYVINNIMDQDTDEIAKPKRRPVTFSMKWEKSEVVEVKRAISNPSRNTKNTIRRKSEASNIFS